MAGPFFWGHADPCFDHVYNIVYGEPTCQVISPPATRLNSQQINALIDTLQTEIAPYFTDKEIASLAKEAGFDKRCSGKINGEIFLKLIMANREALKQQSLNGLCFELYAGYSIDIAKQSLHERFNRYAVEFLRRALESLLAKQLKREELLNDIQGFSRILIKDSTCFDVSDNLEKEYKGSGGGASNAAVRIQFEFDLLRGTITAIALTSSAIQDATDAKTTLELIGPGDLVIRDLGYMHASILKEIADRCASFACRLPPQTEVYDTKTNKPLDFKRLFRTMRRQKIQRMEKLVLLGNVARVEVRLIMSLLPQQIVEQRIRRLNAKQKRKGKGREAISEKYRIRSHFNLFVTNATEEQIPLEAAEKLYKLRWLVELVFKMWKSTWKIDAVKKVNIHRLTCYIYVRLIALVTSWTVIWRLIHSTVQHAGAIPSIDKCSKMFLSHLEEVVNLFCGNAKKARLFMGLLGRKINILLTERHGDRLTQLEMVLLWNQQEQGS
jgi:hypothetical protein